MDRRPTPPTSPLTPTATATGIAGGSGVDENSPTWARLMAVAPGVALVVAMLGVMWALEVLDLIPGADLNRFGIRPRTLRGLLGIAFAPFLHVGFGHLIANSVPFFLLGGAIAWGGRSRFVEVTLTTMIVSGLGVWIFGRSGTIHLGASGVVFGYVTYLVARGIFARRALWLLGGLVVLAMYGGLIWGLFPTARVSWLGHLFGALGGVLAAYAIHGQPDDDESTGPPAKVA